MGSTNPMLFVGAAFALYAFVHVALAYAARDLRIEMVRIAEEILSDSAVSDAGKDRVNHLLDTSISFKVGILIPFAAVGVMFDMLLRRAPERDEFGGDARFHRFVRRYFASVLAVNPVFAVISIPLMMLLPLWELLCGKPVAKRDRMVTALEAPMLRASAAVN